MGRYLVKATGANVLAGKAGILKLLELANTNKNSVIVVPKLGDLDLTFFASVLGDDLAEKLINFRRVEFTDGAVFELCSTATLKNYKYRDAYLALWTPPEVIDQIESFGSQTKDIVFVTWNSIEAENWERSQTITTLESQA